MNRREKLDEIFNRVDDLLLDGKFDEVDKELRGLNPDTLDTTSSLGYLTITFAAKRRLKARAAFLSAVRQKLTAERPSEVEALLSGLD